MIVRTLADVISMGGNLLLDIGPKSDGTFRKNRLKFLKTLDAGPLKISMPFTKQPRILLTITKENHLFNL
jgi:hypothetical protein